MNTTTKARWLRLNSKAYFQHMIGMFEDEENLPEWVQSKITKAADYLNTAHRYMMNSGEEE